MNKKAQSVGLFIVVAIAILVGLILFQAIAFNVEKGTQANTGTTTATNALYTGVYNTPVELVGQELVSVTSVTNRTEGLTVPSANYTISECVRSSDNLKGICYTALDDTDTGEPSASGDVNITYVYYPNGYIDNAGSRAIAGIIILLTAIGIALVAMKAVREP